MPDIPWVDVNGRMTVREVDADGNLVEPVANATPEPEPKADPVKKPAPSKKRK